MGKRRKQKQQTAIAKAAIAVQKPYDPLRFLIVFWAVSILFVIAVGCADHDRYPRDLGPPPAMPATNPNSVVIAPQARQLLNDSLAAYRAGNWLDCVDKATQAIAISPNYGEAYMNRGAAEVQLHHFDEAIADEDKAMELKPSLKTGSPSAAANKAWAIAEKAKH